MSEITRFSVEPLWKSTRRLAAVASGRAEPDLVIGSARALSTYSERILPDREIWISGGRIAALKPAGSYKGAARRYDAQRRHRRAGPRRSAHPYRVGRWSPPAPTPRRRCSAA